jgi:hypothetical protein
MWLFFTCDSVPNFEADVRKKFIIEAYDDITLADLYVFLERTLALPAGFTLSVNGKMVEDSPAIGVATIAEQQEIIISRFGPLTPNIVQSSGFSPAKPQPALLESPSVNPVAPQPAVPRTFPDYAIRDLMVMPHHPTREEAIALLEKADGDFQKAMDLVAAVPKPVQDPRLGSLRPVERGQVMSLHRETGRPIPDVIDAYNLAGGDTMRARLILGTGQ